MSINSTANRFAAKAPKKGKREKGKKAARKGRLNFLIRTRLGMLAAYWWPPHFLPPHFFV